MHGEALQVRPSPRATLLAAVGAALLLTPVFALLGQLSEPSGRERDLAEIRRRLARREGELHRARTRERGLASALESAELDLALQEQRVAEAAAARRVAEAEVERTGARVEELAAELAAARASLRKRVTGLYRLGRDGPLRLALAVEPGSDLPAAVRLLRFLVRRDADAVERYVETRESLLERRPSRLPLQGFLDGVVGLLEVLERRCDDERALGQPVPAVGQQVNLGH